MSQVRCDKNGADIGPPFTDGKVYSAQHYRNELWQLRDDSNVLRYFIPGEPHGWMRHPSSGRRRPNGDPALEYVRR